MANAASSIARFTQLLKDGQHDDARRLAVRLLRTNPTDAELAVALIRLSYEAGAYPLTSECCSRILERRKTWLPALLFDGLALIASNRPGEALQRFDQGLAIAPNAWEFLINRGMACERLGATEDALASYESAVAARPDCVEALANLGNLLTQLKRDEEALERYSQALRHDPRYVVALYNRGILLTSLGRVRDALGDLEAAVNIQPNFPAAWNDLGIALAFVGRHAESLRSYDHALTLAPEFAQAMINRGVVLNDLGRFSESIREFERAETLLGETSEVLNGRAHALRGMGRLDEAMACYDKSVALHPECIKGHIDRGATLAELGRNEEARRSYSTALGLDAADPDAHFNLALLDLHAGNFADGWRNYEHRWTRRGAEPRVFEAIPQWNGEILNEQQMLLVWGEQGVGDEILLASMYNDLKFLGKRCIIECREKLRPLYTRSFPWAHVVARDAELDAATRSRIGFQVPAGSLGRLFRRSIEDFPAHQGYLTAAPARVDAWRHRLGSLGPGLKVGFSWRSSNLTGDRSLSFTSLKDWQPLFSLPDIHWICLQYDDCELEVKAAEASFGVRLHRFTDVDYFDDLDEVGALMTALDLVITAPTSVSLQSAAHGVETWHMNVATEWQTHGTPGFPWLPALHRFGRAWNEKWGDVFARIVPRLQARNRSSPVG